MNRTLALLFTLLFAYSLNATEIPTHIIGSNLSGFKDFTIALIVDSTRNMSINEVSESHNTAQIVNSQYAIPSIKYDYWFIIKLQNSNNVSLQQNIGFNEACFDIANIYYHMNGNWYTEKNGLTIPLNQRSINCRWPIFNVNFNANETKTIYLKLHSKYLVPVRIISENIPVIRAESNKQFMGYWFFFGAAVSILFYNLFLFFQLKNRTYFYYVGYLFFLILWISLWSGFILYISNNLKLYHLLSAGVPVMSIFLILFTEDLLGKKNLNKTINTVFNIAKVILILFFFLILYDVSYYQYLGFIGILSSTFLLYVGIYSLRKKLALSKYFLFAMSFYLIGLLLISLLTLNMIPYTNVSRYGFMIGSFIEFTLFSYALGYRLKLLQDEKIVFQNRIIEHERSMKKQLEIQVNERTQELSQTFHKLELSNKELLFEADKKDKAIEALELSDTQLQLSNQAKDKLFSIIAHDLRSPFNSILGFLNILKKEYQCFTEDERIGMINKIHSSANSTYELLENLLIWSRSQSKRINFNPQKIKLKAIIDSNLKIVNNQLDKKQIKLISKVENSVEIYADLDMMNLIIRNLISNAIKFTYPKGSIAISATIKETDIIISISDTGVGIDRKMKESIFTLSKQTSLVGTNNEKGTGLGLMLCKDFITIHNGKIWVESEVGKGSTFNFSIPFKHN